MLLVMLWERSGVEDQQGLGDLGRYGWVGELIDVRSAVRAAALARHRALLDAAPGGGRGGRSGTLADLVGAFTRCWGAGAPGLESYQRLAGYGVLFLQWEERFPAEWRESWPYSPWTEKEAVLKAFTAGGPTLETGPALADLLLGAVRRVQRCQDRWYWQLARRIGDPALRARLAVAADDASERTRLRARFVLWLLDHPGEGTGGAAWRRWLRSQGRPVAAPATAGELARMRPVAAASLRAGLPPAGLARVLEGLHAGPAARIAAQLSPPGLAPGAVELMDVRMAARMLKAMDPPAAAQVLEAMNPAAAAARFPGPSRAQLLTLMAPGSAVARLRAMIPAAAGQRLDGLPPAAAAALLQRMDPAFAAAALAGMGWWGPMRTLSEMPPAIAANLLARLRSSTTASRRRDLDFELPG